MIAQNILWVLGCADVVAAACSRTLLKSASDNFFLSAFEKKAFPEGFSQDARTIITQNNQDLQGFIQKSIYGNITGFIKPFGVHVLDTESCNVVTNALVKEGPNAIEAIVSVRLKIEQNGNTNVLRDIEVLNALKDSHALFNVSNLPSPEDPVWKAPQGEKKLDRQQLIKIGDSYAEGLEKGVDSLIQAGPDCPRFENGVETTKHCNLNTTLFIWPVTDRRWYADTETGNVVGSFFFHYKDGKGLMKELGIRPANMTTGLWLHEYFKVQNGKIVNVIAAMETLPATYKDIWANR